MHSQHMRQNNFTLNLACYIYIYNSYLTLLSNSNSLSKISHNPQSVQFTASIQVQKIVFLSDYYLYGIG